MWLEAYSNLMQNRPDSIDPIHVSRQGAVDGKSRISASREVSYSTEIKEMQELIAMDKPNPRDIVNVYNHANDLHREEIIPMLTHLNNAQLESIAVDLMMIIRSEMSGTGTHLNVHYVAMLLERLSESINSSDQILKNDFKQLLADLKHDHVDNQLIQLAIQKSESIQLGATAPPIPGMTSESQSMSVADVLSRNAPKESQPVGRGLAAKQGFVEKDTPTGKEFTQDGLKVTVQPGHLSQVLATLPNQAAHVHAFGDKNRLVAGIVQVGNLPPVIVVSGIVEYLLVQQARLRDKKNLYKFAIVTDSVASIDKLDRPENIRLVDMHREMTSQTYFNEYQQLIDEGYKYIISLHVSTKLSRSLHYARQAADRIKEMYPEITCHVVNTYANGLGLGLIISEIHHAILDHFSPREIIFLIRECLQNLTYWVVPLSFDYSRNQKWVAKVLDRKDRLKLKMFNHKPLISLKESIQVLGIYSDEEQALAMLLQQVAKESQKRKSKIRRIGVEHRQHYRAAIALQNKVNAHYKRAKVTNHIAGSITAAHFGPKFIGICMI